MNKIFDESKISTFKNLEDLVKRNKLVGRRNIIIGIDERTIDELKDYIYKANMFDDIRKENKKLHDELLKYEIQNSKLQKELARLKVNNGETLY